MYIFIVDKLEDDYIKPPKITQTCNNRSWTVLKTPEHISELDQYDILLEIEILFFLRKSKAA